MVFKSEGKHKTKGNEMYAYHGTAQCISLEELLENDSTTFGIHFGSKKAAYVAVNKYADNAEDDDEEMVDDFFTDNPECLIEVEINGNILESVSDNDANNEDYLTKAIADGYDGVAYTNEFEDIGSISYVILNTECIVEA